MLCRAEIAVWVYIDSLYLIIIKIGTASDFLVSFTTVSLMLLKKRINNLRAEVSLSSQEGNENTPPSMKTQRIARCRFKQIPQNTKYTIDDPIYPLLGVSAHPCFFHYLQQSESQRLMDFVGYCFGRFTIWTEHGYLII